MKRMMLIFLTMGSTAFTIDLMDLDKVVEQVKSNDLSGLKKQLENKSLSHDQAKTLNEAADYHIYLGVPVMLAGIGMGVKGICEFSNVYDVLTKCIVLEFIKNSPAYSKIFEYSNAYDIVIKSFIMNIVSHYERSVHPGDAMGNILARFMIKASEENVSLLRAASLVVAGGVFALGGWIKWRKAWNIKTQINIAKDRAQEKAN